MDVSAKQELMSIILEFRSITSELYDIKSGVIREFAGIGTERCANSIQKAISQFDKAVQILNSIDTAKEAIL